MTSQPLTGATSTPLRPHDLPASALVVGLGIEGVALTRYLAGRGVRVTVNDARAPRDLTPRLMDLVDVAFTPAFGGHDPALAGEVDALYVAQGVPLTLPLIAEARARGLPIGSITTLLYSICKGQILGITGSAGKTTTTSLVSAIVARSGRPHVLAGNIGSWPLDELEAADEETLVVIEISHTQLQLTRRSPHIACVTNVTPNHLDQFDWDAYVDLKRNHVRHQTPDDIAVLNHDNPVALSFAGDTPAAPLFFSMSASMSGDGAFLRDERLIWRRGGVEEDVLGADEIPLRGRHNVENVLAALAVTGAAGIPAAVAADAIRSFRGVPHRLENVATIDGVTWVNDSIATAPERTMAGLRSFSEPVVLLLGGRDKKLPLDDLARVAAERCRAVICFGEAGPGFAAGLQASWTKLTPQVAIVETLAEAVEQARRAAQPGDVVLLAPAGTSFDAFPNFERRGEAFRALVHAMTEGDA